MSKFEDHGHYSFTQTFYREGRKKYEAMTVDLFIFLNYIVQVMRPMSLRFCLFLMM